MTKEMLKLEAPIHLYVGDNNFAFDYKGELAEMDISANSVKIEGTEAAKAFAYGLCIGLQDPITNAYLRKYSIDTMISLCFTGMIQSFKEGGLDQNGRVTIPAHIQEVWLVPEVKAYMKGQSYELD